MLAIRQKAARYTASSVVHRALCRYSTGQHGKEGDEVKHFAGSSTEHGHHHAGPKNESLGIQLYVVLTVIPAAYAIYHLSQTSDDGTRPALSKIIDSYSYYKERWTARNTLHTAMIEQAAFDRHLFHDAKGSNHIDLKFPEMFNTGSPHNVSAGQGGINLEKVVAHYHKINSDAEEKKAAVLAAKESEQK